MPRNKERERKMAKETKNLKLHQVTRPEDDSKAFNLETILNENWEKLDSAVGDLSQPVTTAEGSAIGLRVQNGRLQYKNNESWTELGLEYEDIQNLAARPDGLVTWALPQSTDNTRIAIVLCRATKDISNMDYSACLADASITKNTLAQNATSNTYSGLTNSTQYWVKAFIKYALGGKEFYSGGVTVTFTTPAFQEISNLTVNPTTELVTWTLPNGSNHTNVEVCYSKTNISVYTYAQCQIDGNVTKAELTSTATSYTVYVLDKATYYVRVFLKYSSGHSNGVTTSWLNPKQWFYRAGNENTVITGTWVQGWKLSSELAPPTKVASNLQFEIKNQEGGTFLVTNNQVNITNLKRIYVTWEASITNGGLVSTMRAGNEKTTPNQSAWIDKPLNTTFSKLTEHMDVSALSGMFFIKVGVAYDGSVGNILLKVYNIWGE